MAERAPGWRQGPDGQWFPPVNADDARRSADAGALAEVGTLVNSGAITDEINEAVDDPEFAV